MRTLTLAPLVVACAAAEPPPFFETATLRGTPYERGHQHGERFESKIRSLYTRLLTNSLLPSLNRDRPDIAAILLHYQSSRYDDGEYAYRMLSESAQSLTGWIPPAYIEEMEGIADGAGLPYEEVLLLNTFVDSVLSVRTVQHFLWRAQAPHVVELEVVGGLDGDGADNDGDGQTDEAGEGTAAPYQPSAHALWVEVPARASLRILLEDPDGVDAATLSVRVGEAEYTAESAGLDVREVPGRADQLEAILSPPAGFPAGEAVTLHLQASDKSVVTEPPPAHARTMRDEFVVLGIEGRAASVHDIENRARRDDRFPPPSIAFAATGAATASREPLAGHHFALLDAGTSHEHAVALRHVPDHGHAHVTIGFAGVVWGTSGMNDAGLVWLANLSDTLDNPLLEEFQEYAIAARLLAKGMPFGIMGREVLARDTTVVEALARLDSIPPTLGWNFLLADRGGDLTVLEMDANTGGELDGGKFPYRSDQLGESGRPLASTSADDIRVVGHFQLNRDDIEVEVLGFQVRPQRYWSSFWHRSLRAFYLLGDQLEARHGQLDVAGAEALLRTDELIDGRDSMNAVVFEPARGHLHVAAGTVPATDSEFVTVAVSP